MIGVYVLTHVFCGSAFFVRGLRGLTGFAGIKGDHHVADILVFRRHRARLIAVCCHAAWPHVRLSLVCTSMCIYHHARGQCPTSSLCFEAVSHALSGRKTERRWHQHEYALAYSYCECDLPFGCAMPME
jgi:hypothetical protein